MAKDPHNVRRGRVAFLRAFPGPWTCARCGEEITQLGRSRDSLNVHHINNEDREDNRLENLEPLHSRCHQAYHYPAKAEKMAAGHRTAASRTLKSVLATKQWTTNREAMMASLKR